MSDPLPLDDRADPQKRGDHETVAAADAASDRAEDLQTMRERVHAVTSMMSFLGLDDTPRGPEPLPEIPGYEVLGELGRGGMGMVYKARQLSLNRVVALKMILAGSLAARLDLARFRAEAEAVARLQHPNIVQIFDTGEHQGQPFFSLELVDGGSLDRKLAGTPLAPRPAAELVEILASAIHYAHQRGLIHRDLKPGNVLLTADGQPKITDFGVAKHVNADSSHTRSGSVIGTPSYMAPEQAAGHVSELGPISDVYSLGAVLYECLTGRPPFKGATLLETLDQVRDAEPAAPTSLQPGVPRDLETICLKCLHKDPKRRYASAQALADDLRRFLNGQPIEARPIGRIERVIRWRRRYPVAAGALAALLVVVIAAFVSITALWRHAVRQRNQVTAYAIEADKRREEARQRSEEADLARARAEVEADKAHEVSKFLAGLFEESDPFRLMDSSPFIPRMASDKLSARDLLDRGVERLAKDSSITPETRAMIQDRIGSAYLLLGEGKKAEPLLKAALEVRRAKPDSPELASTLHSYAWVQQFLGNFDLAERCFRDALQLRENNPAIGEAERLRTLFHLAWLLAEKEEGFEAEQLFRQVVQRRSQLFGDTHREVAVARFALAAALLEQGKFLEGASQTQKALDILKRLPQESDLAKMIGLFQEAVVLSGAGAHAVAERKLLEALDVLKRSVGDGHAYVAFFYGQLAVIRLQAGRLEAAEEAIRQCFTILDRYQALYHPLIRKGVLVYAQVMIARQKPDEADRMFEKMLRAQEEHFGKQHEFVADTLTTYAQVGRAVHGASWETEKLNEALAIYRAGAQKPRELFLVCLKNRGQSLIGRDPAAAVLLLRQCLELTQRRCGTNGPNAAAVQNLLASALLQQGKTDAEVERLLAEARKASTSLLPGLSAPPVERCDVLLNLAVLHRLRKQPADAAKLLRESREATRYNPNHLAEVAREFLRCAELPGGPSRDICEREALITLRQAVRQGLKATVLETDTAFDPLRPRPEFRELLPQRAVKPLS